MCAWMKYFAWVPTIWMLTVGAVRADGPTDNLAALHLSRDKLQSYLDAGDFGTALAAAQRFAAIAERVFPESSAEPATPFYNLALIQQKMRLFTDAERSYKHSIRIVENALGEYSQRLVVGLIQLGILHYQNGKYADALAVFQRAQHITHRNDGVYTLDQLPIVDWISRTNLVTNEVTKADVQQKFYYRINEENYGPSDPLMIPALTKLGNWLQLSGQYRKALGVFSEIVEIMEIGDNYSQLALRPVLRAISSTLYNEGQCCADEPLDRVLEITLDDPQTDAADKLEAIIELADMSLVRRKVDKARQLYRQAWMILGKDGNQAENLFGLPTRLGISRADDVVQAYRKAGDVVGHHFSTAYTKPGGSGSEPGLLFGPPIPKAGKLIGTPIKLCYRQVLDLVNKRNIDKLSNYYTKLDFTVDEYGMVHQVEIVDSNSPVKLNRYVINMLYSTRYRPRLEKGEPVLTDHLNFQQTFTETSAKVEPDGSPVSFNVGTVSHGCQILAGNHI
jgi:tetratricopeptide (TPR) repeat protein